MTVRRRRLVLVPLAAALLGAALPPGAAQAKTFKAAHADDAGDSTSDARDITGVRLAYNRRSGAMSASLTTAAPITDSDDRAVVAFVLSDLVKGKCRRPVLEIAADLTQPANAVIGQIVHLPTFGKPRLGHGTVDGTTYSFRVRHRSFAGKTVGCMYASIDRVDEAGNPGKVLDETAYDIGFV